MRCWNAGRARRASTVLIVSMLPREAYVRVLGWLIVRGVVRCARADACDVLRFFFFSSRRRHTRLQGDWSSDVCSSDLILEHRRSGRKSLRKRAVLGVWKRPLLADRLMRTAAPFSALVPGQPRLARTPYRDRVRESEVDGEPLTIFASCLADRVWPESASALEQIATVAGFKVGFPKQQWCCGLIASNAGDFKTGAHLSAQLASSLRDSKSLIVTPSASCFGAFTMDSPDWGPAPEPSVRVRMRDSTRFVLQLLEANPKLVDPNRMSLKIAYHDSCQ